MNGEKTKIRHEVDFTPTDHIPGGAVGGGSRGTERMAEYDRLRAEVPVAWSDDFGGYWTLTRYADVRAVARNYEDFRSGRPFMWIPDTSDTYPIIPISLNPPLHTVYRRELNKYFTPERMAEVEVDYRQQIIPMVQAAIAAGTPEIIWDFCAPATARGLATLLNLGEDAWQELLEELDRTNELRKAERENVGQSPDREGVDPQRFTKVTVAHIMRLIQERRENPRDPEKDLLTGLITMTIDGAKLDDAAATGIGAMILGAGHLTTQESIGNALFLIATNPGDQARLRRDPALLPAAIEEYLRVGPSTQEHVRRATRDIELHGRTINQGDYVGLNWWAANRDEAQFEHASSVIIDRTPNRHLSFGFGPHMCLGAPLARMEMRVVLEELLARTRSIELNGAPEPNLDSNQSGFNRLPLRLNPA
jgi:cytochrome P450